MEWHLSFKFFDFIRLVHDNLLPLLGYSADGNHLCIVYKYMSKGSLEDALAYKVSGLNFIWVGYLLPHKEIW